MFFHTDIKGNRLPPKTLCLTYDDGPGATVGDGPGPRTEELAHFLHEHDIAATFFVIGQHAKAHRALLAQLREWGHLVGNHSYSHPGLVSVSTNGGDVVDEIRRTDEIIRDGQRSGATFLRPPYGNWRELAENGGGADKPLSIVAEALHASGLFSHYVAPVNWDVVAEDWTYWERGRPAEECAQAYLERIDEIGAGIVLMHDSSEDPDAGSLNRTMEATRLLVPRLRAAGYRFVRLDQVPQVASAMRVSEQFALLGSNDRYVCAPPDGSAVRVDAPRVAAWEQLGLVRLDRSRVAIRANYGLYLSARGGGGEVVADATTIGPNEQFLWKERAAAQVSLQAPSGAYLTCRPSALGLLLATARRVRDSETWRVHSLFTTAPASS